MSPFLEKTLGKKRLFLGKCGADDEARTRYLHLGKVALYQMSYVRISDFVSLVSQRDLL